MRIVLVSIFVLVLASMATADPIEWSLASGGNGHYYDRVTFTDAFLSWPESRDLAATKTWQGVHGHLTTITSLAENDWIWNNLGGPYNYYLGGFQALGAAEPDQGWRWVTGEPWLFTNWTPGEPNNASGGPSGTEDAIEFMGAGFIPGSWNDVDLQNIPFVGHPGFIIEYDFGPVPVQTTTWGAVKATFLDE